MITLPSPPPLFNPLTAPADQPLTVWEILSGPYGLLAFLPLVPLVRLLGRAHRRATLIVAGLLWLVATTGPLATLVLLLGVAAAGSGWIVLLDQLRRRGRLGPRLMIALVWVGLSAMIFPLWWYPQWSWYGWREGSRLAVLHNIGFAYFYLRLIAWGVDAAHGRAGPLRPLDTLCWLLYPPCMRLGPVMLRQQFFERLDAWQPAGPIPWKEVAERFGLFLAGGFLLGVCMKNTPHVPAGGADFFTAPQAYATRHLVRLFYLVPIQVYLLLWTYNELAAALSIWLGIRVDNNFDWLPRATSVRDFWRRWHVTVGRWLRDYIYIPLGGNRGIVPLHYAGVFGFCAVWHGASWSFVVWAASQAFALTVQRWGDRLRRRLGWDRRPAGPVWIGLSWLITMHYQLATIVIFVDFEHCGWRLFRELWHRLAG